MRGRAKAPLSPLIDPSVFLRLSIFLDQVRVRRDTKLQGGFITLTEEMALLHTGDVMVYDEFNPPAEHADFCGTQHMDIKDKAVVTKRYRAQNLANKDKADCTDHIDKCAKETPRPYLTRKILYTEDLWTEWALQPFDLSVLIARRNKDGDMFFIHVASIYEADGVSGFGYIIRDCHGTPIVEYSQYFVTKEITKDVGPVSESYLELKAVDKV